VTGEGKAPGYSGYGNVTISVPDDTVTLYWHGDLPSTMQDELAGLRAKARVNIRVGAPHLAAAPGTDQTALHRSREPGGE
jgi:hypothetical protein